jgi:hypothetical protein
MTTEKLVTALLRETNEVKNSSGGSIEFRLICDFVNNARLGFNGKSYFQRKHSEIAEMVEEKFAPVEISSVKEIYA